MVKLLPTTTDDIESLEPFAQIRVVAADLDGTLLPAPLKEKVQQFVRSLRHYRVQFMLATGRTVCGVGGLAAVLELPSGTPLVLYNGSVVVEHKTGRLLRRATLPPGSLAAILQRAAQWPCEVFAYFYHLPLEAGTKSDLLVEQVLGWSFGQRVESRVEREFNNCLVDWREVADELPTANPCAVLLKARTPEMMEAAAGDIAKLPGISMTRSGSIYLELRPDGSDKSVGLSCAIQNLGFSRAEVLAIGDNDNDAEMLAWAGIGVAIAESSPAALIRADYVCQRRTFEGVLEVLQVVRAARRLFPEVRKRVAA